MLTRNGKNIIMMKLVEKAANLKNFNGTESSLSYSACATMLTSVASSGSKKSLFCYGDGTTKETFEDYKLENRLSELTVDSFTLTTNISQYYETYDMNKLSYRAIVTNNTSSNVTVSEIGIYHDYSNTNDTRYLIYRKTFEPITLAPNDTYTFAIDLM